MLELIKCQCLLLGQMSGKAFGSGSQEEGMWRLSLESQSMLVTDGSH